MEFMANAWTSNGIPFIARSLIEFDLSNISPNERIKNAKLYLYAIDSKSYHLGHSSRSGSNEFIILFNRCEVF